MHDLPGAGVEDHVHPHLPLVDQQVRQMSGGLLGSDRHGQFPQPVEPISGLLLELGISGLSVRGRQGLDCLIVEI